LDFNAKRKKSVISQKNIFYDICVAIHFKKISQFGKAKIVVLKEENSNLLFFK